MVNNMAQAKQMSEKHETAVFRFGDVEAEIIVKDGSVWLNQKQMVDLLGLSAGNVSRALKQGLDSGLIDGKGVIKLLTPTAGGTQEISYYDLDATLMVTYRARPKEDNTDKIVAFRSWAVEILNRHVVRSIRTQEVLDYARVKDYIAQASDYDPSTPVCRNYFASVQNKLLFAVTGMTAAELIIDRVSALAPNLGLHTWQGKNVTKADAQTAKNYLTEDELRQVQALVVAIGMGAGFLMQRQSSTMQEWVDYVDRQIVLFRCQLLTDKGEYSHEQAMRIVAREYEAFKRTPLLP